MKPGPQRKRRIRFIKHEAILLLGPTGSGKTPLGQAMEKSGWGGRRALHFDFGANLREIGSLKRRPPGFSARDMEVIRHSLRTGALLENENFSIAEKILDRFGRGRRMKRGDILVLNGLPRHRGQAVDLGRTVRVARLVYLEARPGIVRERIRHNVGGDRLGRADDSATEVRKKYEVFVKRSRPLVHFYARRGVPILRIPVGARDTPSDHLKALQARRFGKRPRMTSDKRKTQTRPRPG